MAGWFDIEDLEEKLDNFLDACSGHGKQPVSFEAWKRELEPLIIAAGQEAGKILYDYYVVAHILMIRESNAVVSERYRNAWLMLQELEFNLPKMLRAQQESIRNPNAEKKDGKALTPDKNLSEMTAAAVNGMKVQPQKNSTLPSPQAGPQKKMGNVM